MNEVPMQRESRTPIAPSCAHRGRAAIRRGPTVLAIVAAGLVATAGVAIAQTANPPSAPFARGTLTGMSGSTLQVQGRAGTTAVVVNGSTVYEQTKAATMSDVAAGDCIRAVGTGSTSTGIQATTVALSKPQGKAGCNAAAANGFPGGRNGARANGQGGNGRFGDGTGRPPGTFQGNGQTPAAGGANGATPTANFGAAFGTVKSVSADKITVKAQIPNGPATAGAAAGQTTATTNGNTKKPRITTQNVAVTVDSSTALTQTVRATVKDLAVGSCVTATGSVDSVGTVTAKNVTVSQPENGSCTAFGNGFGGGGFFGRGGGANGGPAAQGNVT
jgi:hypothetical protein